VGSSAGNIDQQASAVAVGESAGATSQGTRSVAAGSFAGNANQAAQAIAIGYQAGLNSQAQDAIAIGSGAGILDQGARSVCIGRATAAEYEAIVISSAADGSTGAANSIVLNATGSGLASTTSGFVVAPVRASDTSTGSLLQYNATTSEVTTVAAPSFARAGLGGPIAVTSILYTTLGVSATIPSQPPSSVVAVTVTAFVTSAAPVHVYVSFKIATGATVHVDAADDNALILRADGDGAASATLTHVLPGSVTYPCTVVPWARVVGSGLCTLNSVQLLVHLL
jgi:hypothetical protein